MTTLVIRRPVRPSWSAGVPTSFAPVATTPVALTRDGEDGVLVVEAPGLDPAADLHVQLRGDRLTVAGTRRQVTGALRRESRFSRTVVVPEGVTAGAVSAAYEAGVLRVRVAGMFPAPVEPEAFDIAITSDVAPAVTPASDAPEASDGSGTEQHEADQADQA